MCDTLQPKKRFQPSKLFIDREWWSKPALLLALWAVVTICAAVLKYNADEYNNYKIFYHSTEHLVNMEPLYTTYPAQYYDIFLYGPPFTVLISPFAALPPMVGMMLWVVALSLGLLWAIRNLPVDRKRQAIIIWICLNELFTALAMQQFNVAVAALVIGSVIMIERGRIGWAAFMIMLGTLTKVYGIVGLAFFFFVKRKWQFALYCALWGIVIGAVPMLFSSPEYVISQYAEWVETLTFKNTLNTFAQLQNMSFLGIVRKVSGSEEYSDLWILIPACIMFLLAYLRTSQFKHLAFRLNILASALIFIVIFSSGSENSSHVIAALGVGIWYVSSPTKWGWVKWSLLGLVIFINFSRSLLGYDLDISTVVKYSLKVLPYTLVWLRICYELYTQDFGSKQLNAA